MFDIEAWHLLAELSGMELFVADIEALEAYLNYFYCISKRWTKPLPETYDPEQVSEYFNLRPHVVALRLLEVIKSIILALVHLSCSIGQIGLMVNNLFAFFALYVYLSTHFHASRVLSHFEGYLSATLWEQFGNNWKLLLLV